ncbi:hypothetical protein Nos7524_3940 [Nostoc sp. PCC 7524]|uniref:hypothetical protein n=1 Tax=Nostoc sp. (strain ATCC 29411 / PCC 7524) TaxID=28072 RepID=UPI00029F08E6|nr:hypothetical protein [Nostoc sp. PCC 7524]AFY49713.1 hypothetical protein Nos7524_3940 [Nostoc sp. PCC 7524]
MTDRFHCPRYNISPKQIDNPELDEGLCDFCWYEYCFCWADYCLDGWLQAQTNGTSTITNTQVTMETRPL